MVYRIFVEKKPGQTHEADKLLKDVQEFLQIASLKAVRVINRYDVENIDEASLRMPSAMGAPSPRWTTPTQS